MESPALTLPIPTAKGHQMAFHLSELLLILGKPSLGAKFLGIDEYGLAVLLPHALCDTLAAARLSAAGHSYHAYLGLLE